MRAPISVIIPTLNAQEALPRCLGSLGEGLAQGMIRELIVSDGGSTDDTLGIAESAGAEVIRGAPSRGGQLRSGAEAAQGQWLLFVHADTVLEPGWSDAMLPVLSGQGAFYGRLRFDADGFAAGWVAGWANARSKLFNLPYGDQSLLIHATTYSDAGGFADMPLMEDVVLARKLGKRLKPLAFTSLTSADKYKRQGWLKRGSRNLLTLCRFFLGTPVETLAQAYRK